MLRINLALFFVAICSCDIDRSDSHLQVIYGTDDRLESGDAPANVMEMSRSVGLLFSKRSINASTPDVLDLKYEVRKSRQYCDDLPFRSQPLLGQCTVFLTAPNEVWTAGHCIDSEKQCQEDLAITFAFDLSAVDFDMRKLRLKKNEVYDCKSLKFHKKNIGGMDFAVIILHRDVKDRSPLSMPEDEPTWENGLSVFSISHPFGLPKKFIPGGRLVEGSDLPDFFRVALDTAVVSSGSPILSATSKGVIGVLVGGRNDLVKTESGCYTERICKDGECNGEMVRKLSKDFVGLIK